MTVHVVFVCSGNICRSPIAEKVFAAELERAGLAEGVRVTSAGTGGWHVGDPADARGRRCCARRATPRDTGPGRWTPRRWAPTSSSRLDDTHRRALARGPAERVRLLRSFDPAAPERAEVPDPYYGGGRRVRRSAPMIQAAVPGMLDWVRENK